MSPQPATQLFQTMGRPQAQGVSGPFNPWLSPRPIDTMPPTPEATGWETPGVAGGSLALQAFKDIAGKIRMNRLANAAENEKNNQQGLDQFTNYLQAKLADPDLTSEGRDAIMNYGNNVLHQHAQYELRDQPKGIKGFFSTLLGGEPVKSREPIDFAKEIGNVYQMGEAHDQKNVYQDLYNKAAAEIQAVRSQRGGVVLPSDIDPIISKYQTAANLKAPQYAPGLAPALSALVPKDPFAEALMRGKTAVALQMNGQPAQPGAQSQPMPETAPPPPAPAAPGPINTIRMGPGAGVSVPFRGISMQPTAAVVTAPPPVTENPLASLDLRNPVHREILKAYNYKVPEPGAFYDPSDPNVAVAYAVRHPVSGVLMDYGSNTPLPNQLQHLVPANEFHTPANSKNAFIYGSDTPGGASQAYRVPRLAGEAVPVTITGGRPFYASEQLESVPDANAESGAKRVVKSAAVNQPVPIDPAKKRADDALVAVTKAKQQAGGDPLLAQELIPKMGLPDDVQAVATKTLEDEYRTAPWDQRKGGWVRDQRKRAAANKPSAPANPAASSPAGAAATPAAPAAPPSATLRVK